MTLGFCSSFHFSVWVTLFLSDLCHMIFSIFPATHSSKWPFDSGCILYLPQLNVFILYKYYWLNFSTCNVIMSYRPLVHRLLYISCKLVLSWMFVLYEQAQLQFFSALFVYVYVYVGQTIYMTLLCQERNNMRMWRVAEKYVRAVQEMYEDSVRWSQTEFLLLLWPFCSTFAAQKGMINSNLRDMESSYRLTL